MMSDMSDSENHSKAEYEDKESSSDESSTSSSSSFSEEDVQEVPPTVPQVQAGPRTGIVLRSSLHIFALP